MMSNVYNSMGGSRALYRLCRAHKGFPLHCKNFTRFLDELEKDEDITEIKYYDAMRVREIVR
jgi:hypothetical protein